MIALACLIGYLIIAGIVGATSERDLGSEAWAVGIAWPLCLPLFAGIWIGRQLIKQYKEPK